MEYPEWWTNLDAEQQKTYLEQHPNSKMAKQKRAEEDEGDKTVNVKPEEDGEKGKSASANKEALKKLPKPTQERIEKFVSHLQATAKKSQAMGTGLEKANKDTAYINSSWDDIKSDPDVRSRLENYMVGVGNRDEDHVAAYTYNLISAAERETDPEKQKFLRKGAQLVLIGKTYSEIIAAKQSGQDPASILEKYGITADEWNSRSSKNEDDPCYAKILKTRGGQYVKGVSSQLNKALSVAKATKALHKRGLLGDSIDEDTVNSVYALSKHAKDNNVAPQKVSNEGNKDDSERAPPEKKSPSGSNGASDTQNLKPRNTDGSKVDPEAKPSAKPKAKSAPKKAPAKKKRSSAAKNRILALGEKFKALKEKLSQVSNPKSARAKAIRQKMRLIRQKVLEIKEAAK
jgi:hypothetical protein